MDLAENTQPPEWISVLENKRKRQHKLAHDIGAGAPCLNCQDACSGLDLHFWRKLCRNCKCKKEAHDVKEEDSYEQFEILFGDSLSKGRERIKKFTLDLVIRPEDGSLVKKSLSNKRGNEDLKFDWIPHDIPADIASEYMQQLPLDKVPITGTEGAVFRRQQLQKQIPLYDFNTEKRSDLTIEETQAFADYVQNLKDSVVGQGLVTKIRLEPHKITDEYVYNVPLSETAQNQIPRYSESLNGSENPVGFPTSNKNNANEESIISLPNNGNNNYYSSTIAQMKNLNINPKPFKRVIDDRNEDVNNSYGQSSSQDVLPNSVSELKLPSAFIPHFQVKKSAPGCTSLDYTESLGNTNGTNSLNGVHDNSQNPKSEEDKTSGDNNNRLLKPSEIIISKLNSQNSPINRSLNNSPVHFRDASPKQTGHRSGHNQSAPGKVDGRVCKIGSPATFRAATNDVSHAPLMSDVALCGNNSSNAVVPVGNHENIKTRDADNDSVISPAPTDEYSYPAETVQNCRHCQGVIIPGQVVVIINHDEKQQLLWHPQCFVCKTCKELLVDLIYFYHVGSVYCGRHYAEALNIPRCFACDELIFVKEYTVAENQSFHVNHFCCFECDIPLAGMQYIQMNGNPVCLSCYESKYGKNCNFCRNVIGAKESRISLSGLDWHAQPECFKCFQCGKSLVGGQFALKFGNLLCSKECIVNYKIAYNI